MAQQDPTILIPGAEQVIAWFGQWPSFHDAEVLTLSINREQESSSLLRIRTWIRTNRVDEKGLFAREHEACVLFEFSGIKSLRIEGEDADAQNVISGLAIDRTDVGTRLVMSPSYGLWGEIVATRFRVSLDPFYQVRFTTSERKRWD